MTLCASSRHLAEHMPATPMMENRSAESMVAAQEHAHVALSTELRKQDMFVAATAKT